jgi:PAS domain S-box-containing protein
MMKNKPIILVVDDQLQNIQLLEGFLVRQGYEIIPAESGEEALGKLSGNHVDLVLLDVKMHGMSGFEVLTKLRADKKTQRIPVVMITSHNENEVRAKAFESGCDDFISKPFDQYELLARVKSLLRIKFLNDEVDEAHEFAESVINTVREPLISLDQDLRVVTVNRSFYEFFKVKPEETVGQLIYDLGNKQWDIPKLRELLETILPQKTTFDNYEVEHDFATIGRRIMLLNARQIQRGSGKEQIILLAIEDITERKQLEDLLTESEMRYRRIFETATDGIVLLEKRGGHIVHANPAAEKMLGYSKEEYVGKMLQDIGVLLDMSDFPVIMQTLNKNGIINYNDVEVKTKSGFYIDTDIYMVDRAKLAQCNIRDVTERKLADDKLKKANAFIENALDALKDIFFVFDLEGKFLRWNKAMIAVSGYIDGEIALMKPIDFFRDDDRERVSKAIRETVKESSSIIEALLVTKDGMQIPYEFKTSLLMDHTGYLIGISGVGRDLTERNKLEAQLLHSQKMEAVGTLAGGIAHDFNNMLNVIMGYGSLVMNKLEADSPSKEHIDQMLIAADRAANLTKRLLVFSRKQLVEVKPININELILDLQKMLVRIISENIDFNLDLADMPLIALADAGQIEQVLINLAVNAKDAMQGGGRLTISTGLEEMDDEYVALCGYGKPGKYALIKVSDTGHGMDGETKKKIFDPFFTTKNIGEGTGLGLAISYGIIKQHCGFINVYSEPGQGTVFKIYLPLSEEPASPNRKMEADVPVIGGNETVLVAEDDVSLRELTRIILESFGYTVISAEDGEDVITKFMENKERISLILLDMIMPKKNGKEVSEAIRKVSPRIKILFTSGYTMDIIKSKEWTEPGFDFIHKPFQPTDLLKKVREILDR